MYLFRKFFSSLLILGLCFWGVSYAQKNNQIVNIRVNELGQKVQVVLDMERAPEFNSFFLANPYRLVVDVDAKLLRKGRYSQSFSRGVKNIRTGKRGSGGTRIVVDLKKKYEWQVEILPPGRSKPNHRVVIEIYDEGRSYYRHLKATQKNPEKISIELTSITSENSAYQQINLVNNNKKKRREEQLKKAALAKAKALKEKKRKEEQLKKAALAKAKALKEKKRKEEQLKKAALAKAKALKEKKRKEEQLRKAALAKAKALKEKKRKEEQLRKAALAKAKALEEKKRKEAEIKARYLKFIKDKDKYVTVIVDPGHGGYDSGALGKNKTLEKQIVLKIAKKIKQKIDAIPYMRAKLTRTDDRHVKLRNRLDFAHKYEGDLLVSIHADAHTADYAKGSSVYILSNQGATSEIAKILAETQSKEVGETSKAQVDEIQDTIVRMQQDVTIENSYKLARSTIKHLKKVSELHKHTVERGNFAVLKAADIPSVLIETGFISNIEEEKKLKTNHYQSKMATAITAAIKDYAKANFSKKMKSR